MRNRSAANSAAFLATGAAADLEHDVLVVVGILGKQQDLDPLVQNLLFGGNLPFFVVRQIPHLGIFLHLARVGRAPAQIAVDAKRLDQLPKVRVFLGHLLEHLAIRQDHRIGQFAGQLFVTLLDRAQLGQQQIIEHGSAPARVPRGRRPAERSGGRRST